MLISVRSGRCGGVTLSQVVPPFAGDVHQSIVGAGPEDAWLVRRFRKAKIVA